MSREYELARHGVEVSAPVLAPLGPPSFVGGYAFCSWPFVEVSSDDAEPGALADALKCFHDRMTSTSFPVGSVQETARSSLELARNVVATAAMPQQARTAIIRPLEEIIVLPPWHSAPVVHGEPQSRNCLVTDTGVILIDLEGAKRAPIECDLAFLSPELVERFWPAHDRELLQILRADGQRAGCNRMLA